MYFVCCLLIVFNGYFLKYHTVSWRIGNLANRVKFRWQSSINGYAVKYQLLLCKFNVFNNQIMLHTTRDIFKIITQVIIDFSVISGWDHQEIAELKKHANWDSHMASSSILCIENAKLYFFLLHFIILPISLWGRTFINFWIPHHGNFYTSAPFEISQARISAIR